MAICDGLFMSLTEINPVSVQGVCPELFNWVDDGVFVLGWQEDPRHLVVLYHNAGFEHWLVDQTGCDPQNLTELPPTTTALLMPQVLRCRQTHRPCQWRHPTERGLWEVILLPVIHNNEVNQVQGVCRPILRDAHYSSLVQQATDIIAILDAAGQCAYVSPSLGKVLGYAQPPPGFLLEPPFLHPQDRDPVHHAWQTALSQAGHQVTYQCRVRHAQGHWVVLEVSITNLLGDPQVQGIVFNGRDITIRRQAEDRLRHQNSYLSSLHRTSLALLHRQDIQHVLQVIMTEVTTLLSAPDGFLFLVEQGELVLRVGIGHSLPDQGLRLQPGEHLPGWVWQSGAALGIPNTGTGIPTPAPWTQTEHKAAIAVPLLAQRLSGSPETPQVIGVLGIAYTDPATAITSATQEILEQFAHLASLALANHTLIESAQRELRQRRHTQEHLGATLRSIGDGVIVTNREGQVQSMNPMAEALTGWSQDQARGQSLQVILPLVDAHTNAPTPDPVETVLQTQRPVELQSQTLLRDPQSIERYMAASAAPIVFDEEITGVVITFRDITQHKLTELSLRQSEARTRAILDALPDLVLRLDRHGRYLFCKGDPKELIRPAEDLLGKRLIDVIPLQVAAEWMTQIRQTLDDQAMHIYEYPLTIDREERWYEARLIPSTRDEVIALVRNVTEQRHQQHQHLQRVERQRLLSAIALRIRQSLDLDAILQRTVAEVRQFAQMDRVVIYRFTPADTATVIAESVRDPWLSLLGHEISHEWIVNRTTVYCQDQPRLIPEVETYPLPPLVRQYFERFQVKATLALPLFQQEKLWGLLVLHHCQGSRDWAEEMVQALQELASQVEIAIQQAHLHRQLQLSNEHLERQVRVRTAQLNKQVEALQRQEHILSTVQNAVITIHIAGHITYWNRFAETLYGVSADAALGEFFTDVMPFPPAQAEEVLNALRQGQSWSGELVLTTSQKVLFIQQTPTFSSTGALTGAISISLDITHRQAAEKALRESETRLRTLSETTTAAIFVLQEGHFLDVNPALSQITGYSRAALLGMSFWHLGDPDHQPLMQSWIQGNHAVPMRQEFAIVTPTGETKWIECTLGKVPYKGFLCTLGTAVDITHRKQLELQMQQQMQELQQLNLLKDDFLSTVSHELRTPMANMKMSIHMLKKMILEGEQPGLNPHLRQRIDRYLQILHDECLREIDLINDLLDLQRLEQGGSPYRQQAIDLHEALPAIAAPFFSRVQARQQTLHLQVSPELPIPFYGDRFALARILSELLNNACKYSPPQATITLGAEMQRNRLHLYVSNTGSEIPPQEQERIFDKFYRVVANDRWKQGGTGLGLALIKKMVEHQQGQIRVESHDQCTTFHIDLPWLPHPISPIEIT